MEEQKKGVPFEKIKDEQTDTTRDKLNYSKEVLTILNYILFCGNFDSPDVKIYGSSFDKLMKYPSDIDVIETIRTQDINEIVNRFKEIIKGVLKSKTSIIGYELIFGDIKCGIDHDFDIDVGQILDMKIVGFNPNNIIKSLKKLVIKKRLDIQKFRFIESLILNINENSIGELTKQKIDEFKQFSNKYDVCITNWLDISDQIYQLKVLRWTVPDILAGKLKQNNKIHKLGDCVGYGMTKIDLIYFDKGEYLEISNYFNFKIKGRDNNEFDAKRFIRDVQNSILENLFFMPSNIMKGFKLIHTASKFFNDNKKYRDMLNSDLGILSKCKAEISTCIDVIVYSHLSKEKVDINTIFFIIDNIRNQLNRISDFNISTPSVVFRRISDLFNQFDDPIDITIVSQALILVKTIIENILNEEAFKYAKKHNLLPIDLKYLPSNKPIILKN